MNLHGKDLVPTDATDAEPDLIVHEFRNAGKEHGIVVPMATSLLLHPIIRHGVFNANDLEVRA